MATSRRKTPARWLMAGLSGLATAGFLAAILSGPHPTDATPAAALGQGSVVTAGDGGVVTAPAFSQPSDAQPQVAQPPVVMAPPRFRTRGS